MFYTNISQAVYYWSLFLPHNKRIKVIVTLSHNSDFSLGKKEKFEKKGYISKYSLAIEL